MHLRSLLVAVSLCQLHDLVDSQDRRRQAQFDPISTSRRLHSFEIDYSLLLNITEGNWPIFLYDGAEGDGTAPSSAGEAEGPDKSKAPDGDTSANEAKEEEAKVWSVSLPCTYWRAL